MNNILYFDNVKDIGNLYLEYIFFEFESEPILFLCVDEEKNIYLCICSDIRYGQRWIITKCSISTLESLINEEFDIASAFLLTQNVIAIDMDLKGNEISYIIERDSIDKLDLPKEGTYIRCDKIKAKKYLYDKKLEFSDKPFNLEENMTLIYKTVESYTFKIEENETFNIIEKTLNYKTVESYTSKINENEIFNIIKEVDESLKQSIIVENEYCICKDIEKYIDNIQNDDYLQAA